MTARQPATSSGAVLTSRIGRRLIALFVGCALVPLALFAWLALEQVTEQLKKQAEHDLHVSAKSIGMNLAGRLGNLASSFDLARNLWQSSQPSRGQLKLPERLREQFRTLFLTWGGDSDVESIYGERPRPVLAPNAYELQKLAAGHLLLRTSNAPDGQGEPRLTLVCAVRAGEKDARQPLLVAEIRNEHLFDCDDMRANGTGVAIYDRDCTELMRSGTARPDIDALRSALGTLPSSGMLEWSQDGKDQVARYWRLFMQPKFGTDLIIVQTRARADVTAPLVGFQWIFSMTAIAALLLVVLASLVQIRRTLVPISRLRAATHRVAEGNLSTQVEVTSRDEFGDLARSFNFMTSQLQESIRKRAGTELQLVAARDEALAAARAKSDFLTNVSHELRTPLTSILSSAEIMTQYGDSDAEVRGEFVGMIAQSAKLLTLLIDNVLELTAQGQVELSEVELRPTLEQAVTRLTPETRALVALEIEPNLPKVVGAAEKLSQVWDHLLENAVKFGGPGNAITVRARPAEGARVAIEVQDRGPGIAAGDLERIFEPFVQVGRDIMTSKAPGVGLGLTLARHIVTQCGGTITVRSRVGEGSTFVVRLQAVAAKAATRVLAPSAAAT